MRRRYVTTDVFTDRAFGGNPLAVVLDAEGLTTAAMQAIAREFGYAETAFVLPPADPAHTAHIRIFTPIAELPFAGHPNIGTALVLARHGLPGGVPLPEAMPQTLMFEELAGLIPVALTRDAAGRAVGAELTAPEPLSRRGDVTTADIAALAGLPVSAIVTGRHPPLVASVGLGFVFAELDSVASLAACVPDAAAFRRLAPLHGADALMVYVADRADRTIVHARMFAPLDGIPEDPATGSATAALAALLGELSGGDAIALTMRQGEHMGRPSLLHARAAREARGWIARVAGGAVEIMQGTLALPEPAAP